jgi:hypothetical protein
MQEPSLITLRIGATSGAAVAATSLAYAVVLLLGLSSLHSPADQIPDPWFTLMEVLILLIAPLMVAFSVAICFWVPAERRILGSLSVAFFSMCASITMAVHLVILVMSRSHLSIDPGTATSLISFHWPSVAYVLDILAWDIAFPIGAVAAFAAIPKSPASRTIRTLIFCSSALALAGLVGVPLNNMQVRNVGIIGYTVLFPIAAGMMSVKFLREARSRAA